MTIPAPPPPKPGLFDSVLAFGSATLSSLRRSSPEAADEYAAALAEVLAAEEAEAAAIASATASAKAMLGATVKKSFGPDHDEAYFYGRLVAYRYPYFRVEYDDGDAEEIGLEAAANLLVSPDEVDRMKRAADLEAWQSRRKRIDYILPKSTASRLIDRVTPGPPRGCVRRFFWHVVTRPRFDHFIMACILVNCVTLAMYDPLRPDDAPDTAKHVALGWLELALTLVFVAEAVMKIAAFHFWRADGNGYIQDPWSRLDFAIVVLGIIEFIPIDASTGNLTVLRAVRVFRPLRSIGKVRGMRVLIESLVQSAGPMLNVTMLLGFFLLIFALIGNKLFMGALTQRCFAAHDLATGADLSGADVIDSRRALVTLMPDDLGGGIEDRRCGGHFRCPRGYSCRATGPHPKLYDESGNRYKPYTHANPMLGIINFDDVSEAVLAAFVSITLEGWTLLMYQCQDAFSYAGSTVYFVLLIVLTSFFALNLALAVISDNYAASMEQEEKVDFAKKHDTYMTDLKDIALNGAPGEDDGALDAAPAEPSPPPSPQTGRAGACRRVADASWFNTLMFAMIILNIVVLAVYHKRTLCVSSGPGQECVRQAAEMDATLQLTLERCNMVFVAVFSLEIGVKAGAYGWRAFFADEFNSFDFVIVLFSVVELVVAAFLDTESTGLSALRIFRLARVFKLARSWKSLRKLIQTLVSVLPSIGYLSMLLGLFMFIASVAGMQLFGDQIPPSSRANFSSFGIAVLTVFQMISGEDWNMVMYEAIHETSHVAVVYFLFVVVIGNFVVLNLFIAILLSSFSNDAEDDEETSGSGTVVGTLGSAASWFGSVVARNDSEAARDEAVVSLEAGRTADNNDGELVATEREVFVVDKRHDRKPVVVDIDPSAQRTLGDLVHTRGATTKDANAERRKKKRVAIRDKVLQGYSLGFIAPTNPIRQYLARLSMGRRFDNFILACIIVSTLSLAADGPTLAPKSGLWYALWYADRVFTSIFVVELAIKVVAQGFLFNKHAYLRSSWNQLDCTIVIISLLTLLTSGVKSLAALKSLRALRAFRPLRTIKRAPGMRVAVQTLFACMPAFVNILLVAFVIYLVFAIIGVQQFAGLFWSCNDANVANVKGCVGEYLDKESGETVAREWSNQNINFDNVYVAMLSLFEVASLELWLEPLYAGMDAPGRLGQNPQRNGNPGAALYFIVFIIIGSFLVLNLFVGVVVDNFNRLTEESSDKLRAAAAHEDHQREVDGPAADDDDAAPSSPPPAEDDAAAEAALEAVRKASLEAKLAAQPPLVTVQQQNFIDSVKLVLRFSPTPMPRRPNRYWGCGFRVRMKAYDVLMRGFGDTADGSVFESGIIVLILANIIVMCAAEWVFPANYEYVEVGSKYMAEDLRDTPRNRGLDVANTVFTGLFLFEVILKYIGWGWQQYWADSWNRVDFVVVATSIAVEIMDRFTDRGTPIDPNVVRVLRLVKLVRIVRMLDVGQEVVFLVETLIYSLPAIANIACLWFIVLFIFAILGMSLYGEMALNGGDDYPYGEYNRHTNFRHFHTSIVTLFRMSTGEAWNAVMHDIETEHPNAWLFFVLYMLIVSYLLFNLLVAVVLSQFSLESEANAEYAQVTDKEMAKFATAWSKYDPLATQFIAITQLPLLILRLAAPLPHAESMKEAHQIMRGMSLRVVDGHQLHFVEVFVALCKYHYSLRLLLDEEVPDDRDPQLWLGISTIEHLLPAVERAFPSLPGAAAAGSDNLMEHLTALKIQSIFRARRARVGSRAQQESQRVDELLLRTRVGFGGREAAAPDRERRVRGPSAERWGSG